jgi:hypothetical protein
MSEFGRNDNDDEHHLPLLNKQPNRHSLTTTALPSLTPTFTPVDYLNSKPINTSQAPIMAQTRAINALAPFLALSKSATSARAAADLVTQATSATHTYVFGELLQTPNMQSLRDDAQYSNHYTLLELFAWGTWAEYQGNLPPSPLFSTDQRLTHPSSSINIALAITSAAT